MKKIAIILSLVWAICGCATQMVEQNAKDSCASQGKKAFIFDAKQNGIPLLIESASVSVMCVGPDNVTHLPESFGADVVSSSNFVGAGILAVTAGSSAEKAGIKPGDIVVEFAGNSIENAHQLRSYVERVSSGAPAVIKIRRNGKDVVATVLFPVSPV
jgi:S1-C subfamily serine protease